MKKLPETPKSFDSNDINMTEDKIINLADDDRKRVRLEQRVFNLREKQLIKERLARFNAKRKASIEAELRSRMEKTKDEKRKKDSADMGITYDF